MKKFLLSCSALLVAVAVLAQTAINPLKVNPSMQLSWDLNDPGEGVQSYNVRVNGTGTNTLNRVINTPTPPTELVAIMTNFPNGVYIYTVTAVNEQGIESVPSDPFWVFWYGRPSKPANLRVEFIR